MSKEERISDSDKVILKESIDRIKDMLPNEPLANISDTNKAIDITEKKNDNK